MGAEHADRRAHAAPIRVATDIGGTFTDLVLVDPTGRVELGKASTTPAAFAEGVSRAVDEAGIGPDTLVESFVHGSTVIINTLTERTGSPTALVTTRGFRDVLEIGRSNRPDLYNLRYRKPPPYVDRHLRLEVTERMSHHGEVVVPLAEDDVLALVEPLRAANVRNVAICLLHSYANPAHERRCAELLTEAMPGVYVTQSHTVTREWREYERTSTAVLNAYVQDVVDSYIDELEGRLARRGIHRRLRAMQSNGGVASFAQARRTPINLVESGPVGGVIGAASLGRAMGEPNLITLDIGGTTAKCSLVEGGEIKTTTDYYIEREPRTAGYPIKVPTVDIVEIGSGGGSIAWFNEVGALRIGPRSAGAVPGPACYPNGGDEPTLTDANVVTGRMDPESLLGGALPISADRARAALEPVATRLGVGVDQAALGIIRLANANLVNAIKLVSVRRGYDPRDYALVAFGGAGPMHAAFVAEQLGIRRVVIPPAPGHFSAWGMLTAEHRADWVRTQVIKSGPGADVAVERVFAQLEREATEQLTRDEADVAGARFVRSADIRYVGQEHTVKVPIAGFDVDAIADAFDALHERAYTFRLEEPIELVTFYLTAFIAAQAVPEAVVPPSERDARIGTRLVDYDTGGRLETPLLDRSALGVGRVAEGPAIIADDAASTVVLPGQTARIDATGSIVIDTGVAR